MSKSNVNPADPFKKALAEATKSLANEPELNVAFTIDPPGVSNETIRLPQISRSLTKEEVMLARGTADAYALKIRFHNAKTHNKYMPQGQVAKDLYEAMETVRVEALGARVMPGTASNIDAKIKSECVKLGYDSINEPADVSISVAASFLFRQLATNRSLPKVAQDIVNDVFTNAKFTKLDKTELAYEINKSKSAIYAIVETEATGDDIKEFTRKVNITKTV